MTIKLRTIGIVILAGLALVLGGAALFVYSGVYNIAATKQHTKPVYLLLQYAMRRSVKARSDAVSVPDLNDRQRILSGASHYRGHCLQCHGAPGVAPHNLAYGMTPAPANLVGTAREWHASEIYWVIRHGIKMSGMPAWEYRLSDSEMWDIVAFVMKLPTLSPVEYAELDNEASKTHPHPPAGGDTAHGHSHQSETEESPASHQSGSRADQSSPNKEASKTHPHPPATGDTASGHGHRSGSAESPAPHQSGTHAHQSSATDSKNAATRPPPVREAQSVNGYQIGNVEAGRRAVSQYLCATCHQIPGIVSANRHVGPPLNGMAKRRYIGGIIVNNPENMVRWLQDPQHFDPLSAMPNLGITEKDARDISAFLYTLEDLE